MGPRVALLQKRSWAATDRPSAVWAQGPIRRGTRIGEIISEIADSATKSPGRAEEFEDEHKEAVVRGKNIDLFRTTTRTTWKRR